MSDFLVTYGRALITGAVGVALVITGSITGNPVVLGLGLTACGTAVGIQVENRHGDGLLAK